MAAALASAPRGELAIHVVHDERVAAFVALGLGLDGVPAVLLCTSGTAAANFHPAVVEAGLSDVPMLVVTADRPPELRDVGAPQTIDQTHLYGRSVRWFHDAIAARCGRPSLVASRSRSASSPPPRLARSTSTCRSGSRSSARSVEIPEPIGPPLAGAASRSPAAAPFPTELEPPARGDRRGRPASVSTSQRIEAFAVPHGLAGARRSALGVPVAPASRSPPTTRCCATSGSLPITLRRSWCGSAAHRRRRCCRSGSCAAVRRSSRWAARASSIPTTTSSGSAPSTTWLSLTRCDRHPVDGPLATRERARRGRPHRRRSSAQIDAHRADGCPDDRRLATGRRRVRRRLVDAGPRRRVVRRADRSVVFEPWSERDRRRAVDRARPCTRGPDHGRLLGDIAFVHDSNAMVALRDRGADLRIVVVDNGGGGIFSFLPQATGLPAERFEQLFGTPHDTDIEALARAHGIPARTVSTADELRTSLAEPGPSLTRIATDRAENVREHARLNTAVVNALG
jgi:2-succinyl-5-enolpyruvyl-6-hydroxy-3-cyclohexene-1-carboxylate synthase